MSESEAKMSEYDQIAKQYRDSKLLPFRDYIESYTLFKLASLKLADFKLDGALAGKTVLDLACGEGHYARRFMRAGAAEVLGVESRSATPVSVCGPEMRRP